MKRQSFYIHKKLKDRGTSLFELLIVILLSGVIFGAFIKQFNYMARMSTDENIRVMTQLQAQSVMHMMTEELRQIGNGVPFEQYNFQIGESTLSDTTVTLPIITSTMTANKIQFRTNETGMLYMIETNFDPSSTLTIDLVDTTGLAEGDPIYLNNNVIADDDGLYGVIDSVNTTTHSITLESGPIYSPGAVFNKGTLVEEVPIITYNSPNDGSGITRDSGYGAVLLAPKSTFALQFLDSSGTAMTIPLETTEVVPPSLPPANSMYNLRSISLTVTVTSQKKMRSGQYYTATVTQIVSPRNFNYVF